MAKDSWYLGKNLGVPAGTWKSMGKKLGIGLTEGDLDYKQRQREQGMMDRGITNTPEGQYEAGADSAGEVRQATAMGGLDYMSKGKGGGFRGEAQNMVAMNKPASEWTSQDVSSMQDMLNRAGYTDWEGKPLTVDSQLGGRTVSALKKYQEDMGRGSMSGVQGPRMESGLMSDSRDQEQVNYYNADIKRRRMEEAGFKMPPTGSNAWE